MDESVSWPATAAAGFEQMMLPHLGAAYNLARWLLRHEQDAEDCVQDAYLRAYKAFDRFRGQDARAWLLTIVRNACYSRLRQNQRREPPIAFDEELHGSAAADDNDVQFWQRAAARELLNRALEQLPAEFREVLVLHEIEGLSYKEIAAVTEIPLGTVMSRLARARARLHAELKQLLKEGGTHELR